MVRNTDIVHLNWDDLSDAGKCKLFEAFGTEYSHEQREVKENINEHGIAFDIENFETMVKEE